MVFPVLVTASLINTLISVSRTMVRLPRVLHRGVSLAGDCIFNKHRIFLVLVTVSLITTAIPVFRTVVRLPWVLHCGVSLAGDCIFNNHCYRFSVQDCGTTTLDPTLWCFLAGDCIFNKALLSLCSGLWYDYTGSYTVVFSLLATVSLKSLCVQD